MSRDKPQSCPKIVVPSNSLYCWVLQASFEMVTITAFIFAINKDRSIFTPSLIILELVASVLEFWVSWSILLQNKHVSYEADYPSFCTGTISA